MKHGRLAPDVERKTDCSQNGDAKRLVIEQLEKEKKLMPLRIDDKTLIYVTAEKHNEAYRQEWIEKYRKAIRISDK